MTGCGLDLPKIMLYRREKLVKIEGRDDIC